MKVPLRYRLTSLGSIKCCLYDGGTQLTIKIGYISVQNIEEPHAMNVSRLLLNTVATILQSNELGFMFVL